MQNISKVVVIVCAIVFSNDVLPAPLHVISYNVANTDVVPNYQSRSLLLQKELDKVIDEFVASEAYFVIFLQEVFTTELQIYFEKRGQEKGFYVTSTYSSEDQAYNHGLMIITNVIGNDYSFSQSDVEEKFTPWHKDFSKSHHRGILSLCIEFKNAEDPLCFVNTHTAYTPSFTGKIGALHNEQLNQAKSFLDKLGGSVIVGGDFNLGFIQWASEPENIVDENLNKHWAEYVKSLDQLGFFTVDDEVTETYSQDNNLAASPRWYVRMFYSLSEHENFFGRLDHIFYKKAKQPFIEFCQAAEMKFTQKVEDMFLSDHYAVSAVFEFNDEIKGYH